MFYLERLLTGSKRTQEKRILFLKGGELERKQPSPKHKTYQERTIEFGVLIDRHLYKNMAVRSGKCKTKCKTSKSIINYLTDFFISSLRHIDLCGKLI